MPRAPATSPCCSARCVRWTSGWRRPGPSARRRRSLKTPDEALILASIVEKETGKAADRTLIAAVFQQPAAHRHAAADRPDRDLRHGRALRRQPAQGRPADRHALEHLHPRRPAAHADRHARQGLAAGRGAAGARQGPVLRGRGRRHQPVQRQPRRAQPRRQQVPARRNEPGPVHQLRGHRRRRQVHPHRGAGRGLPRRRPHGGADARAGRHAAGREAARAGAERPMDP